MNMCCQHILLKVPKTKTAFGQPSFWSAAAADWNTLHKILNLNNVMPISAFKYSRHSHWYMQMFPGPLIFSNLCLPAAYCLSHTFSCSVAAAALICLFFLLLVFATLAVVLPDTAVCLLPIQGLCGRLHVIYMVLVVKCIFVLTVCKW